MTTSSLTRRPDSIDVAAPITESYSDRPRSSTAVGGRRSLTALVASLVAAARGR